ncbi:MAG TPA: hypothetical protein VGG89_07090 [Candidatus Baltobacteraceae bacterium]|jgi:hypothetical protein
MKNLWIAGVAISASLFMTGCGGQSAIVPPPQSPYAVTAPSATANAIKNACFAGLTGWKAVKGVGADKSNPASGSVSAVKGGYKTCKGAAFAGTTKNPAPNGFWGVSQTVKMTKAGKLSWWYWGGSTDQLKYGDQEVDVVMNGKTVDRCYKELVTNPKTDWKLGTCSLKKYAGKTVTLEFGVYDNGYSGVYDYWYVSDVTLE